MLNKWNKNYLDPFGWINTKFDDKFFCFFFYSGWKDSSFSFFNSCFFFKSDESAYTCHFHFLVHSLFFFVHFRLQTLEQVFKLHLWSTSYLSGFLFWVYELKKKVPVILKIKWFGLCTKIFMKMHSIVYNE